MPGQVHGTTLAWVGEAEAGRGAFDRETVIHDHDGLLTAAPGLGLAVSYADCVPVVIVARGADGPELAVVHAGWRGMLAGIVGQAAAALARRGRLLGAVVGPSIGPCCFTVDDALRARFAARFPGLGRRRHRRPLGLRRARAGGGRRAAGGHHASPASARPATRASSRTAATTGRQAAIWRSPGGRKREPAPEVGAPRRRAVVQQFVPRAEVVRERFAEVSGRVAAAAAAAGRDPADVRVLVATKYVAAEHLGVLRDAGVRLIGENRAQDLVAKHALYGDAFEYHFIGHLQSRKTRLVLPLVSLIHSVEQHERRAGDRGARRERRPTCCSRSTSPAKTPRAASRRRDVDAFLEEAAALRQGALPRADVHAAAVRRRRSGAPVLRAHARAGRSGFRQRGRERILSSSYRWARVPTTRSPCKKARPSCASAACSSDPVGRNLWA